MYEQIYNDEIVADELLVAFRLLADIAVLKREVQQSIRNQTDFDASRMFLIDGAYHVLFAVGQLADKRDVDRLCLDSVSQLIPDAIQIVSDVVSDEQDEDESFSFNRYFKDSKTRTRIAARIQSI